MIALFLELAGDLRRFVTRLDNLEFALANLVDKYLQRYRSLMAAPNQPLPKPFPPPRRGPKPPWLRELEAAAQGTSDFAFHGVLPNQRGHFRIAGLELKLSVRLTDLLNFLAADHGASSDHLVAWKPREAVLDHLARNGSPRPSDHTLDNLLTRLRNAIEKAGINRYFVHTSPAGVRFARRRPLPGPARGDQP